MVSVPVFTEISTLSHPTSMEQGCISDRFSTLTLNMIALPAGEVRGASRVVFRVSGLQATGDQRSVGCSCCAATWPPRFPSK